MKIFTLILILISVTFMQTVEAREYEYAGSYAVPDHIPGFSAEEYEVRMGRKLERGLKNFFLGWLEIPQGVKSAAALREQEYLPVGMETFFVGFFQGTFKAVGRMGVGMYETFTFPYAQEPVIQEMDEWLY